MYAYRLCEIDYRLTGRENEIMSGKGSLWIAPDSILIKSEKWWYLPSSHINKITMDRDKMSISLKKSMTLEFKTRNSYILNALYHYIEGVKWVRG